MRIVKISVDGLKPVSATRVRGRDGQPYWLVTHGQQGRGRWQIRLPLHRQDFPCPVEGQGAFSLEGIDLRMVPLEGRDPHGNQLYILRRAEEEDGRWLVLWSLSPGFRGGASYAVEGFAHDIARGYEAQGDAGRMGGAPCPMVSVSGACMLRWTRSGRLYGEPASWIAKFDGASWKVGTVEEIELEAHLDT